MRTSPSQGFTDRLEGNILNLSTIFKTTRRDGIVVALTDHDAELLVDGTTYKPISGYTRSPLRASSNLAVDNLTIEGPMIVFDSTTLNEVDIRGDLYNDVPFELYLVFWDDLSLGKMELKTGNLARIINVDNKYSIDLRGLTHRLTNIILEQFGRTCRADLFDTRCALIQNLSNWASSTVYVVGDRRLPITYNTRQFRCITPGTSHTSEPSWDTVVGNTTTETGGVEWITERAWVQPAQVSMVLDPKRIFLVEAQAGSLDPEGSDDFFQVGRTDFTSGNNNGFEMELRVWTSSIARIELLLPMPRVINVGDTLDMIVGCNLTRERCKFFLNIIHMRAEPFMPGISQIVRTPDSPS